MKTLAATLLGVLVLLTTDFSFAKKVAFSGDAAGSHSVDGHVKKNGTTWHLITLLTQTTHSETTGLASPT